MQADQALEQTMQPPGSQAWIQRREWRSISRALARVPSGAAVLDMPCGSGRWLEPLVKRAYRVTCADPDGAALARAAGRWRELAKAGKASSPQPTFVLGDLLQTGFPAHHFDAVVCTGFFDRLGTSDLRIEALRELWRISRGPVVVSFCNAFALGALQLTVLSRRSSGRSQRRIPVPVWAFLNDLRRAGLKPVARHAVLWGISPLWHIVSVPDSRQADGLYAFPRTAVAKSA